MTIATIIIFGLITASFIETLAYRSQRKISIITPPSFCDHCKTKLKIYDKIPVISWLLLRGRCRYCGKKIPLRYLLSEITVPVIYTLIYLKYSNIYQIIVYGYLFTIMMYLSLLDIDTGYISIYDIISLYIGSAANLVLAYNNLLLKRPSYYLFGALSGTTLVLLSFLTVYLIKRRIPIGGGDLFIIPALSSFFGYREVIRIFIISSTSGVFIGAMLIIAGLVKREHKFPLIPYLTFGIILEILLF